MKTLSPSGEKTIDEIARRHGFSREAVVSLFDSLVRGNGTMAQFDHPELGGAGQWMGGGMIMVSDMFNNALKRRIGDLAPELAQLVTSETGATGEGHGRTVHERVSLFVPPASGGASDWWPAGLGAPTSTGAQNDVRYAYFAGARRLAIELHGRLTVYDTLDHELGSFSQQQSRGGSLTFESQHGLIDLADLPVVSGATGS